MVKSLLIAYIETRKGLPQSEKESLTKLVEILLNTDSPNSELQKTNCMVERVNLTINAGTIHKKTYGSFDELEEDLKDFLIFYNLHRRHWALVKELKVNTPLLACQKWISIEPELFVKSFLTFDKLSVPLNENNSHKTQQPCEL